MQKAVPVEWPILVPLNSTQTEHTTTVIVNPPRTLEDTRETNRPDKVTWFAWYLLLGKFCDGPIHHMFERAFEVFPFYAIWCFDVYGWLLK